MHLDAGAIERDDLDANAHQLLQLHVLKQFVEHARFCPAAHARVNGMPVAKLLGQASPLATMLGHIQNGVDHL